MLILKCIKYNFKTEKNLNFSKQNVENYNKMNLETRIKLVEYYK
jgi:hypothetical protein